MSKHAQLQRKIFLVSTVFLLFLLLTLLLRRADLTSSTPSTPSAGSPSPREKKSSLQQELKLKADLRDRLMDVSTWKLYENREFRIRFRVPQEAKVTVLNDDLMVSLFRYDSEFYAPTRITFVENKGKLSIDQWYSEYSPPSSEMTKSFRHFSVKGREAASHRIDYISPGALHFYVNFGDKVVLISPMDTGDPMNVIHQDDIRMRIVDTIERIE